jgi:hypothetical protein
MAEHLPGKLEYYSIYELDRNGRIKSGGWVEFRSDKEAIEYFTGLVEGFAHQVGQGARKAAFPEPPHKDNRGAHARAVTHCTWGARDAEKV